VVEVDLAGSAVLPGSLDPRPGAGLAAHPVADLGGVRQAGRHHVARRHLDPSHPDPVRRRHVEDLEDVDELVAGRT
jgi:hypothetical protein